jgi:hypothetical protein
VTRDIVVEALYRQSPIGRSRLLAIIEQDLPRTIPDFKVASEMEMASRYLDELITSNKAETKPITTGVGPVVMIALRGCWV